MGGLPPPGGIVGSVSDGSYASLELTTLPPTSLPPTTKNLPCSWSPATKVRGMVMFASVVHVVVDGS